MKKVSEIKIKPTTLVLKTANPYPLCYRRFSENRHQLIFESIIF